MKPEFESPYWEIAILMPSTVFAIMLLITITPKRENPGTAGPTPWMMTGLAAACSIGAVMLAGAIHKQDHLIRNLAVHGLYLILAHWWLFQITLAACTLLRPLKARALPPEWGIKHHAALNAAGAATGLLTAALSQINGWTVNYVWMGYGTAILAVAAVLLELRAAEIRKQHRQEEGKKENERREQVDSHISRGERGAD